MPDWICERGIGEIRFARIVDGEIVEARILLEGTVAAGTVLDGRLIEVGIPALADAGGQQYLLPRGAPGVTQGAAIRIEVTRETIPGAEPWKRPLARIAERAESVSNALEAEILPFPAPIDRLEQAGWFDVLEEARSGIVRFDGGELRLSLTPAMTLIDVDGRLAPAELALKAAKVAARTILRHAVGGSIGIDLPTISGKEQRQAVGAAIDATLPQPFERTAMNGFGFIQIVRPRARASLFELASDRPSFEARSLLRNAAMSVSGATVLVAHPSVSAVLERNPAWLEDLSRQVGGPATLRSDPSLPIHGAYAHNA
ncbi:ribonuclease [Sphingomonas daechungensis]|uniref:ribonuclease n=1 Tax=Sphingomonas daechungensis TaxID=1176646 RepID=UPI00378333ED